MSDEVSIGRRPLKSRGSWWASALAGALVRARITPNAISVWSIVFAAAAGAAFLLSPHASSDLQRAICFVCAAAGIQLRLICNLLDGMVAIEGGMKSKTGDVFNDLPDRIADSFILVPAGYAVAFPCGAALGWCAAVMAVFLAYIRLLGSSLGLGHDYRGPMAKPHRMATITIAAIGEAVLTFFGWRGWLLASGLTLVIAGGIVTAFRRTSKIMRELEAR